MAAGAGEGVGHRIGRGAAGQQLDARCAAGDPHVDDVGGGHGAAAARHLAALSGGMGLYGDGVVGAGGQLGGERERTIGGHPERVPAVVLEDEATAGKPRHRATDAVGGGHAGGDEGDIACARPFPWGRRRCRSAPACSAASARRRCNMPPLASLWARVLVPFVAHGQAVAAVVAVAPARCGRDREPPREGYRCSWCR